MEIERKDPRICRRIHTVPHTSRSSNISSDKPPAASSNRPSASPHAGSDTNCGACVGCQQNYVRGTGELVGGWR